METTQATQVMQQKKPRSGLIRSLQEAMDTIDMSSDELIKYHEAKYKRCYGCNTKNKTYKNSCDCHKKKKCSGCNKLKRQCDRTNIHCDDDSYD
jgi:hypothetical protein